MVDCGGSGRQICAALERVGICGGRLDAIFTTHEHTDHIKGVGIMSRRFNLPVYATQKTWAAMENFIGRVSSENIRVVRPGEGVGVGGLEVLPFSLPHDAGDPVGYRFDSGGERAAVATDLGHMTDKIFSHLAGCDTVLLESNHDIKMLWGGGYPEHLKKRIDSSVGHLSNDAAAAVCARLVGLGTKHILLGHLSLENNHPEIAYKTVGDAIRRCGAKIGRDVYLAIAGRNEVSPARAI